MFKQILLILFIITPVVFSRGLLLLYRPKDVSNECVMSHHLRYDLSYGMGMSDTITLVFRNMKEIDYQCIIEIVTESAKGIYLLVAIHFPNTVEENCAVNSNAFTVLKKTMCLKICNLTEDRDVKNTYFTISVRTRVRFRYISNSSINSDMDASVYEITATSAREMPQRGCNMKNETLCIINEQKYCFTSGVVCDGIKNCGIIDWFDEKKSECTQPLELIGYAPVTAVVAVILCILLAVSHFMLRYLPLAADSFFIFNANEDNRLCIDPVYKAPDPMQCEFETPKRTSLIPVSSSSSDESQQVPEPKGKEELELKPEYPETAPPSPENPKEKHDSKEEKRRKTTMRAMTELFQRRFRSVTKSLTSNVGTEEYI